MKEIVVSGVGRNTSVLCLLRYERTSCFSRLRCERTCCFRSMKECMCTMHAKDLLFQESEGIQVYEHMMHALI